MVVFEGLRGLENKLNIILLTGFQILNTVLIDSASHRISNLGKKKVLAVWVNSIPWVFSTK
jgi:hypothetical protein